MLRYDYNDFVNWQDPEEMEVPRAITKEFIKFLKKFSSWIQFGIVITIDGMKGAGKSTLGAILGYILIDACEHRTLKFWTSSDKLVPAHIKAAPKMYKNRIGRISKLADIQTWDVVVVDEGIITTDAKEALTIEKRDLGKGATILRHKSVIFIICSVRPSGVIAALREDADIRIYKKCNEQYIQRSPRVFVKDNGWILKQLDIKQALLESDYKKFGAKGGIQLDASEYCPWILDFDEEISLNMRGSSLAIEEERALKRMIKIQTLARELLDKYGKRMLKSKADKLIKAWIRNEKPKEMYLLKYTPQIIEEIIYIFEEEGGEFIEGDVEEEKDIKIPDDPSCAEFFKEYYKKNCKNTSLPLISELWIKGLGQRDIAGEVELGLTTVNKHIKNYRSGTNIGSDDLRFAYCYEFYIANPIGKRAGGVSDPDLWILDKTKILGPAECKLFDNMLKSLTFFQTLPRSKKKTLEPSYLYCKEHGIPFYPLFYRNVKWGDVDLLIPIEVEGPNKITISKADLKKYTFRYADLNRIDWKTFYLTGEVNIKNKDSRGV